VSYLPQATAIILQSFAQGAATLADMFPGRTWLALGSGQRLNEDVMGLPWPEKAERNARLRECALIIAALLRGETIFHHGHVTAVNACLIRSLSLFPRYSARPSPKRRPN
jgi:alkanesulfonate monooxygenase SsuD/methylene tetrahydromethanopterin reductase-like flavin-dependent oxidoreductase (luciferase family)